jgi:hypothetical protein
MSGSLKKRVHFTFKNERFSDFNKIFDAISHPFRKRLKVFCKRLDRRLKGF